MGVKKSREIFGHELNAWYAYARRTISNLEAWPTDPSMYQSDNHRLRLRRTLDFVRPEDRVFDVGFGKGYLCGLLLRDGGIAAYHGIDVISGHLESSRRMLEANGLEDREVEIEIGDLYELTPARVAKSGATLMICCEVLEHVHEPERALAALAAALPATADLLFSVPLHGRLESVWGHVTVFDVARLQAMINQAGLFVHHVEPLANQWTLVVASKDPRPSLRVRRARSRPANSVASPLVNQYDFVTVAPATINVGASLGTECAVEDARYGRVKCDVVGNGALEGDGHSMGGVTFPVSGLTCLKLECSLDDFDQVVNVYVDVHSMHRHVGRWTWQPKPPDPDSKPTRRFALRPAESTGVFHASGFDEHAEIDRVSFTVEVPADGTSAFALKAAYLP